MRHAAGVLRVPYGAIYDAGYFPSYYWSRYMMAHYPPEIRAWIVSKGGLTPDLKILRGAISPAGSYVFIKRGGGPI
jgi:hypothetical protein